MTISMSTFILLNPNAANPRGIARGNKHNFVLSCQNTLNEYARGNSCNFFLFGTETQAVVHFLFVSKLNFRVVRQLLIVRK